MWVGLVAVVAVGGGGGGISQLALPTLAHPPATAVAPAPAAAAPEAVAGGDSWPAGLQEVATAAVAADTYLLRPDATGWAAVNPAQRLQTSFTPAGVSIRPTSTHAAPWSVGLTLPGMGRGQVLAPVATPEIVAAGGRVEYRRGALSEWYVNDTRGLEQGFTLATAPAGDGPVTLGLNLTGDLTPQLTGDARGLTLTDPGGTETARYDGLVAFDATGTTLPAHLDLTGTTVRLVVDDTTATYPLTIDPVSTTQQAKLTATDATAVDLFGDSVAVSGDTAVIGASATTTPPATRVRRMCSCPRPLPRSRLMTDQPLP